MTSEGSTLQVNGREPLAGGTRSWKGVGASFWRYLVISVLVVIPCFWHTHVEAGDLGSHLYNAWLFTQVEHGGLPGLYIVPQYTNVLTDAAFTWVGEVYGFSLAEKIVVPLCVLIFFWGAFAFVSRVAARHAWSLVPLIAMLAYGYSFQMGFLNYYLSLGFAFFGVALIWRSPRLQHWIAAALLMVLAAIAHPSGLLALVGIGAYAKLAERLAPHMVLRWSLLAAGLLALAAANFRLRHVNHRIWETRRFFLFNGSDQFWLFGTRYLAVAAAVTLISVCLLAWWYFRERTPAQSDYRTPAQLWALLVVAAAVIPEMVVLNLYPAVIGPIVSRTTSVTAVLALAVIACAKPKRWYAVASTAFAVIFFAFLYADTSRLDRMETNASILVHNLPPDTRIIQTIGPDPKSRIPHIGHLTERSFIGHAFSYANYEPPTQQFRIRIRPWCRISARTTDEAWAMETGKYRPRTDELPLKQLYQCSATDPTQLCLRDLKADELNCPHCKSALDSPYP